jgi:hypothetical protein
MAKRLVSTNLFAVSGALALVLLAPYGAYASSPAESVKCTHAPRAAWVSEARIREHFGESQYVRVVFKTSKNNCYEFYAIGKDGSTVEAYYDPVSMALVRFSRVEGSGKFKGTAAPAATSEKPELKTQPTSQRAVGK